MSSGEVDTPEEFDNNDVENNYKPPPEKTIEEILAADQEDESLRKYKEALLGQAQVGPVVVGKFHILVHFLILWNIKFVDALKCLLLCYVNLQWFIWKRSSVKYIFTQ